MTLLYAFVLDLQLGGARTGARRLDGTRAPAGGSGRGVVPHYHPVARDRRDLECAVDPHGVVV